MGNSPVCNVCHSHCGRIGDLGCQKPLSLLQVGCNLGTAKNSCFVYFLFAYSDRKANTVFVSDARKASVNRLN